MQISHEYLAALHQQLASLHLRVAELEAFLRQESVKRVEMAKCEVEKAE